MLPSLYVPVAANCRVVPRANKGLAGVTAIETRIGWPTVSVAEPVIDPEPAVIVDAPTPTPVARPPAAMVATDVKDELHVTLLDRFWMLPSLYVPVAVNCWVVATAIEALAGLIDNEVRRRRYGQRHGPADCPRRSCNRSGSLRNSGR